MRSDLSLSVPNCFWKRTVSKLAKRDSKLCFLSVLKKNSASAKRGRITFSLPLTTSDGSLLSMFETKINLFNKLPSLSITGKYFW